MKFFTTLFDIAVLPVYIVKDTFCALPDLSAGCAPFSDTRAQCQQIDEDISK